MKRLPQYDAYELRVADIYFDDAFNCRGTFTPQSVVDLANSIAENGLQFPIVVQPYHEEHGRKYRLLAGHRRFRATTIFLKWKTIAATVRTDLDEHQARILNLTENLERKDLNMLEEAKALRNLYPESITLRDAAAEIKRPTRWIHARFRLLEMPEEVQQWAAAGLISAINIETLYHLESDDERIYAARQIVHHKNEHGRTRFLNVDPKYRRSFRARRTKQQIADMIAHLYAVNCNGLVTRALAWVSGGVEDEDLDEDIKNASRYEPPEDYTSPFAKGD
jgi:ParB family chromosome partitioning protein